MNPSIAQYISHLSEGTDFSQTFCFDLGNDCLCTFDSRLCLCNPLQ